MKSKHTIAELEELLDNGKPNYVLLETDNTVTQSKDGILEKLTLLDTSVTKEELINLIHNTVFLYVEEGSDNLKVVRCQFVNNQNNTITVLAPISFDNATGYPMFVIRKSGDAWGWSR